MNDRTGEYDRDKIRADFKKRGSHFINLLLKYLSKNKSHGYAQLVVKTIMYNDLPQKIICILKQQNWREEIQYFITENEDSPWKVKYINLIYNGVTGNKNTHSTGYSDIRWKNKTAI